LARQDGAGTYDDAVGLVPPLRHFRLVAESAALERLASGVELPYVRLYERVAGVRLRAAGFRSGTAGHLVAWVRSPRGRLFAYAELLAADRTGTVSFTLPYPTAAAPGRSHIEGCEIQVGDDRLALPPIPEGAIARGLELVLRR
jgi:hypothetical protein